jgi:hypothetical protein
MSSSSTNSSQQWVVDAIEERMASIEVEGAGTFHLPQALLPRGAKEGDVLRVTIEVDTQATKAALDASAAQVKKGHDASAKRDPGGDITL